MTIAETVARVYHNLFNAKFAIISAACNGPIAAWVNREHGTLEAIAAGATQAASSFLSTGFTARLVQHFSPMENRLASYFFGSLIPAAATLVISYAGHWLNDTPERLESCIAPVAISYATSFVTNYITRRGHLLPGNYPKDF